jgi:hypothetical protein
MNLYNWFRIWTVVWDLLRHYSVFGPIKHEESLLKNSGSKNYLAFHSPVVITLIISFITGKFCILPTECVSLLCVNLTTNNKLWLNSMYNIHWLIFLTERECVFCEVGSEFSNKYKTQVHWHLQGVCCVQLVFCQYRQYQKLSFIPLSSILFFFDHFLPETSHKTCITSNTFQCAMYNHPNLIRIWTNTRACTYRIINSNQQLFV